MQLAKQAWEFVHWLSLHHSSFVLLPVISLCQLPCSDSSVRGTFVLESSLSTILFCSGPLQQSLALACYVLTHSSMSLSAQQYPSALLDVNWDSSQRV